MINVIIQRGENCLGSDFYNWIFNDDIFNIIMDGDEKQAVLDNSIIIYSTQNKDINKDVLDYFNKFKNKKYGLFHIADENNGHDLRHYNDAKIVYRNFYWNNINAKIIPLGPAKGMMNSKNIIKPANQRKYIWSFAGQFKHDRKQMTMDLSTITPNYIHQTLGFVHPTQLSKNDLINLYSDSMFCPCPIGSINIECYRLYECLEWGCIPVVKNYGEQNYNNILGNHPFIKVDNWKDFNPTEIAKIDINKKQEECYNWYRNFLKETKENIKKELLDKIG